MWGRLTDEARSVARESQLTWPEFRRSPAQFLSRLFSAYSAAAWRTLRQPNVAAGLSAALLAAVSVVALFVILDRWGAQAAAVADRRRDDLQLLTPVEIKELEEEKPEKPDRGIGTGEKGRVGFAKGGGEGSKPKFERAGGGGGGGREEALPAQQGKIPPPSPIPAAIPKVPPVTPPLLPAGGSDIDRALYRDLPYDRYGDPTSRSKETSSGPGKGGGMGTGSGTGTGSGEGGGFGPGRGGNIGGGDRNEGGGGAGGGRGTNAQAAPDPNRVMSPKEVTVKARIISKPEPTYTEEARKNQTSGTVVLRAVLSASGQVTGIRAVSGLPFGLTERAIAAARQIKFTPAQKDGRAVSQYIQIEYNFNLY